MRKIPVISHRHFVRDLGRGAIGEDIVQKFLTDVFGLKVENVSTKNPDYDLLIVGLDKSISSERNVVPHKLLKKIIKDRFGISSKSHLTIEVKLDEAAAKYENFFIEIFFDIKTGSPGTFFKTKADIISWVVPAKPGYNIYFFKKAELLAWIFNRALEKNLIYKTPRISPQARGVPLSIKELKTSIAFVGEYYYTLPKKKRKINNGQL